MQPIRSAPYEPSQEPLPGSTHANVREDENLKGMEQDEQVLQMMRDRLSEGVTWWQENWDRAAYDLKFLYGDQWETAASAKDYDLAFTINQLPQYVRKIVSLARNSQFSIHVQQVGGPTMRPTPLQSGGQVGKRYSLSNIMEGVVRDIERRSGARWCYTDAVKHAVESGFGWLRLVPVRRDDDPLHMAIEIEHVMDRFSCMLDPQSGKADFKDARWGSHHSLMDMREFKVRYPDYDVPAATSGTAGGGSSHISISNHWWSPVTSQVRIIEYFWKEPSKRVALALTHPFLGRMTRWADETEHILDEMFHMGFALEDEQEVNADRLYRMLATEDQILEQPVLWPTNDIPLFMVPCWTIDWPAYREFVGAIRFAHDAQRLSNYWTTEAMRRVAAAPLAQYVASPQHIAGYEDFWNPANARNQFVMMANPGRDGGMPQRQEGSQFPGAEMLMGDHSRAMMNDTVGVQDASLGKKSNETSGRAVFARQDATDTGQSHVIDHMTRTLGNVGEALVHLAPYIYTHDQIAHVVFPDDAEGTVFVNHRIVDRQSGAVVLINSLDLGRFTCHAEAGPLDTTMNEEYIKTLGEVAKAFPQVIPIILPDLIQAMHAPGKDKLVAKLRQLQPPSMLSPEEAAMRQPEQPTPQQQLEMMRAQADQAMAQAKMIEAESKTRIAQVEEQSKVEIARIKAESERVKLVQDRVKLDSRAGGGGSRVTPSSSSFFSMARILFRVTRPARMRSKILRSFATSRPTYPSDQFLLV